MKILLQHRHTGLYFQSAGVWTRDPASARDFRTSEDAIHFIRSECLPDVEVAAVFLKHPYVESIRYPRPSVRPVRGHV